MAGTYSDEELRADVAGVPQAAFHGADEEGRVTWLGAVLSVKSQPRAKHDIRFYTAVARLLADTVCSTQAEDFADEYVRDVIKAGVKPGDLLFAAEGNPQSWKTVKVTPAMAVFALRVQEPFAKAARQATGAGGSAGAAAPDDAFAGAVREFVQAQAEQAKEQAKKAKQKGLSFSHADRLTEVGLANFPKEALPSEDLLAKLEAAGSVAADRGRIYVGSADGDDFQLMHRPAWTRSPTIDVVGGGGTWAERMKASFDMRKARSFEDQVQYVGYATFLGHAFARGMKLVLMKACTQTHLLAYVFLLTRVAEEYGGVYTAFYYDLMIRKKMAQALEFNEGDVLRYFLELDKGLVTEAKEKAKASAGKTAKTSQAKGGSSSASAWPGHSAAPKGHGKGGQPRPAPASPVLRRRFQEQD